MKTALGLFIAVSTAVFFSVGNLSAGEISLSIRSGSTYRDGNVSVFAEVKNIGEEAAHNVWVEANCFGRKESSGTHGLLAREDVHKASVLLGEQPEVRGIYSIIIKVHYEDANGKPFSLLSYIPFISAMPDDMDEGISAELVDVSIRNKQDAALIVSKSVDIDSALPVSLHFVLPDELTCSVSDLSVVLGDSGQETIPFKVGNESAIAGSLYAYYVVADYVKDGLHRSVPVHGRIQILPRSVWPSVIRNSALGLLVAIIIVLLIGNIMKKDSKTLGLLDRIPYLNVFMLVGIFLFILYKLQPALLFANTVTVGGDVPAHNYLASHLKEQLFGNGRIISWSHGWWCGFPMFQYYFCLPYVLIALLDCAIPFNVAFKLISVLGMLVLPLSVYCSARIMRAPRPVPIIAAVAMLPYLFVRANTMWGVSAYSSLAGMISNSISFPLMVLFVASAYRDSDDGCFRLRSVALFALLISSHFFTSLIAGLTVLIFPLLKPSAGYKRSFLVLAGEAVLGLGLMAWWLVPLIAKREFSVEFGTNWDVPLWQLADSFPYLSILDFPPYAVMLIPFALYGLYRGCRTGNSFIIIHLWMLLASAFLFLLGFHWVAHVFVNIRLWPFMFYAFLLMASYGIACLIDAVRGSNAACIAVLLIALVFGIERPNEVDDWAKWNFEGLENKKTYSVFTELVEPLQDTAGRLANDLSVRNDRELGSSRIFELVPHLIGKPILEGGIVNSAIGSIFSYYIQGETSESCAGFPSIVKPATFNFNNATRHLELFNVKHFIARWEKTKDALSESPEWQLLGKSSDWELYELMSHDGSYVVIPENHPLAIRVDNWKQSGLDWIYDEDNLDQLYILLRDDEAIPEYVEKVESMQIRAPSKIASKDYKITISEYSSEKIIFDTDAIGLPHLIKCTYFPNWKMKGGGAVYMVTPCFMLVYPQSNHVELYYASLFSDTVGRLLAVIAFVLCLIFIIKRFANVRSKQSA